jgi:protein-tyrosine phosphatase
MTTAEGTDESTSWNRRVDFEGPSNFRDLGGYPTTDGGVVRTGLVYRADSLHLLTEADLTTIEQLGLRSVFDLRSDEERSTHPNPIADAVQLAVIGYQRTAGGGERPSWFEEAVDGEKILRDMYVGMLEHSAPLLGRFFRSLISPEGLPVVFHCHAGKDRTGVIAALILAALGVERETILDDYELTSKYRKRDDSDASLQKLIERGLPGEAAIGLVGTPRWAMADTLDAIESPYGGIEAYLTGPVGLSAAELGAIRAALVGEQLSG